MSKKVSVLTSMSAKLRLCKYMMSLGIAYKVNVVSRGNERRLYRDVRKDCNMTANSAILKIRSKDKSTNSMSAMFPPLPYMASRRLLLNVVSRLDTGKGSGLKHGITVFPVLSLTRDTVVVESAWLSCTLLVVDSPVVGQV